MNIVCWLIRLFGGAHKWRRPKVGEVADSRYCRRCGVGRAVKKRKPKENA